MAQMASMVGMETGWIWWVDGMVSGGWEDVVAAVGLWLVVPTGVAEQCTVNKGPVVQWAAMKVFRLNCSIFCTQFFFI